MSFRPSALVIAATCFLAGVRPTPVVALETTESCLRQIPASLGKAVEEKYPTYRLPLETDNLPEDISANRKVGGSGCLGVAHADFDGDGSIDYVLILSSKANDDEAIVVAALKKGGAWATKILDKSSGRIRLYVEAVSAGTYEHTESFEPDAKSGDLASVTCAHAGLVTGATEASGVVFCLTAKRWQHSVVSD